MRNRTRDSCFSLASECCRKTAYFYNRDYEEKSSAPGLDEQQRQLNHTDGANHGGRLRSSPLLTLILEIPAQVITGGIGGGRLTPVAIGQPDPGYLPARLPIVQVTDPFARLSPTGQAVQPGDASCR